MTKPFAEFENYVGFVFDNKELLQTAFTHRSYLNENRKTTKEHNERLEFLGDAVLELVITDFLYQKYPKEPEGMLTAYRSALVNTQSISAAAQELKMNDYLLLSRGEAKDTGRAREAILANTFEAFIGALYMDKGYDTAKTFIGRMLFKKIDEIVKKGLWQDAKSRFQEKAQEHTGVTPHYTLIREEGPDHDKVFVMGAFLDTKKIADGAGVSKQIAEQAAARNALDKKKW